jgi:lipopolysaccharide export system protein LptC
MKGERITTVLPLILVGMLVAFTFWLDRLAQPVALGSGAAIRHDPDYMVDGLSAMRMSESGAARYTLSAAKMVHYPDDDTTLLTTPRLVNLGAAKAPVTITSNQAVVSSNGEHVYFQDDVRVTRAAFGDSSELLLRTAYLHVIPDDNLATTDRAVTITDAATTVTAVGLELNSETRVMKLLAKVRGTYDPNKSPRGAGNR